MGMTGEILGDAYINVTADTAMLAGSLNKAKTMVSTVLGVFGRSAGTILGTSIAGAILTGVGVAVAGLKAFSHAEEVSRRLADTMAMVGINAATAVPKVDALAVAIMRKTTLGDEEIKSAVARGIALGIEEDKIKSMTVAAVGLSGRLGMGIEQSMRMLVRASQGHTQMFSRMGVQIDKTASKQQQFEQIMAFSRKGMLMQEGATHTLVGAKKQLGTAIGEVMEAIGDGVNRSVALTSAMNSLSQSFFDLAENIAKAVSSNKFAVWIDTIVGGLKYMWSDIVTTGEVVYAVFSELSDYVANLQASFVNALYAAIVEPWKWQAESIAQILTNMWANIKSIFSAGWDWLKSNGRTGFAPKIRGLMTDVKSPAEMLGKVGESFGTLGRAAAANPFAAIREDINRINRERSAREDTIAKSLTGVAVPSVLIPPQAKPPAVEAEKMKASFFSFADLSKHAMEASLKSKEEKAKTKLMERQAKAAETTNEKMEVLITEFKASDFNLWDQRV